MGLKFFDLFAGVGGFRLGMERAGHECIGACEWDKYARETYNKNFGHYPEYNDAKDLHPQFDVLCAGFPCQAFSIAGKRMGFEDTRGTIFFEIARIAKEARPRYLFLENVKGLLNHKQGHTFRTILSTLDELGYDAEWQVLNSKYFVPQNRERIFIIGHLRGERTRQVFPLGELEEEFSEKTKDRQTTTCLDSNYWKGIDNHGARTIVRVGQINKGGQGERIYDPNGLSTTLSANGGGRGAKTGLYAISHTKANMKQRYQERDNTWCLDTSSSKMAIGSGDRIRKLTPKECERLQGFPDNWTQGVSDTQRYKQMGNAVTVDVVEYIARCLE